MPLITRKQPYPYPRDKVWIIQCNVLQSPCPNRLISISIISSSLLSVFKALSLCCFPPAHHISPASTFSTSPVSNQNLLFSSSVFKTHIPFSPNISLYTSSYLLSLPFPYITTFLKKVAPLHPLLHLVPHALSVRKGQFHPTESILLKSQKISEFLRIHSAQLLYII